MTPHSLPTAGRYRRDDGAEFELMCVARHCVSGEWLAVYRALAPEGGEVQACPVQRWMQRMEYLAEDPPRESAQSAPQRSCCEPPREAETVFCAPVVPQTSPVQPFESPQPAQRSPEALLKRVFGYDAFREGQRALIDAILCGQDALGVMPTGAGKSLCYQVPALALCGCALVISPLISLMKDQTAALKQAGVAAAYINSSLSERQQEAALRNMADGMYAIVYVAPERLRTRRFLAACRQTKISMVAVDEAHCISQWGQDFRPSYLEIPVFLAELGDRPRLCAFTATATRRVREDIVRLLGLRAPFVRVTGFDRPNLYLRVEMPRESRQALLRVLERHQDQSGIVYCATRKRVEQVWQVLRDAGFSVTRYHAGLSDAERRANQEDFSFDQARIMVATNAFGMGIDKADVRFVVHYNMPKDLESYYQEAGRAGRDGEAAECVLFFRQADVATQRFLINQSGEESGLEGEALREVRRAALERLDQMIDYCRTSECLRGRILRYFGQDAPERCANCANCLEPRREADVTDAALRILDCVREIHGYLSAPLLVRVLRGSRDKRILHQQFDRAGNYGALRALPWEFLSELVGQLIAAGYLSSQSRSGAVRLGSRAQEAFDGGRVLLRVPELTAAVRRESPARSADEKLFAALRALRMRIALRRGVPAYMIFSDVTLRAMCDAMPQTPAELLRLPGVGETKLRAYGEEFLRLICRWRQ